MSLWWGMLPAGLAFIVFAYKLGYDRGQKAMQDYLRKQQTTHDYME